MDNTYRNRLKCINSVAVSENIMRFLEGSKLCETYEILDTDHRRYIIDININGYFNKEFSNWNNINKLILDLGKYTHREKFGQLIDKNIQ